MAALGSKLPGNTIMLQSSGSFFAYEPILKALQSNHTMPLAHYIAVCQVNPAAATAETCQAQAGRTPGAFFKDLLNHGNKLFGSRAAAGMEANLLIGHTVTLILCLHPCDYVDHVSQKPVDP